MLEVLVRRQQHEIVPSTKLNEQGIDRADLDTVSATGVTNLGCLDVIFPIRLEECDGAEALDELGACLRPREALQKFLQDETGGEDLIGAEKRASQDGHLGLRLRVVAAQRQRPDARIDEQAHRLRTRCAL
jgi:hypothetical protein